MAIAGTGNDELSGGFGNDTLVAGPGSNVLCGGDGDDTYIVHKGDGRIHIRDSGSKTDNNTLVFDGVNATQVTQIEFKNDGLVISYGEGDQVQVHNNDKLNFRFMDKSFTHSELVSWYDAEKATQNSPRDSTKTEE